MFSPTITHDSTSTPEVKFTLHRIGFGRRAMIDSQTVALRQRLRELETDYPPQSAREKELSEQLDIAQRKALAVQKEEFEAVVKADVEPLAQELAEAAALDVRKRRKVLDEEYASVQAQIHCVWIKHGLVSVEGGEFGGMTPAQLLEYGPADLAREIVAALFTDGRVAGPEAEQLKSPGTSGAAVPTGPNNMTVPDVVQPVNTSIAIASGTFLAQ